jgi:hypothetical protein
VSTRRCRLLVSIGDRPDARRYHPLLRELLQSELNCRDQQRYIRLHREAAEIWQRRGDLNAAYRHLNLIGDIATANNLVLAPALVRLDRDDLAGLARAVQSLPGAMKVDDPALAMDIAAPLLSCGRLYEGRPMVRQGRGADHPRQCHPPAEIAFRAGHHRAVRRRCQHGRLRGGAERVPGGRTHRWCSPAPQAAQPRRRSGR